MAGQRRILGVEVRVWPFVPDGTAYAIPQDRALVVVRDDTTVETDRSVCSTSDRVAVKATTRVGFAFVHPQAIVRITPA